MAKGPNRRKRVPLAPLKSRLGAARLPVTKGSGGKPSGVLHGMGKPATGK